MKVKIKREVGAEFVTQIPCGECFWYEGGVYMKCKDDGIPKFPEKEVQAVDVRKGILCLIDSDKEVFPADATVVVEE